MAAPVIVTGDIPPASQINAWFVNIGWARKTSSTDRTSTTTFTDDPHLTLPVAANAVYLINSTLLWHSASTSAGEWKFQFTAPTGALLHACVSSYDIVATNNQGDLVTGLTLNTTASGGIVATAEPWNPAVIDGTLVTLGTAGNFTLQWAQAASSATITRLQVNSFISLRRME